jgi:hypothetical protein
MSKERENPQKSIIWWKWALSRLLILSVFVFILNLVYTETLYPLDVQKYSRVRNRIDSAFRKGDIIYLGESSNSSFNPWTDTLNQKISDYLDLYLPDRQVESVTHEGYHPGLFKEMLNLLPDDCENKVVVLGVNMRTCGPSAIYSSNEASNQREALFYSRRPALLTRTFMGLHYYDNRDAKERERLKFKYWRTKPIALKQVFNDNLDDFPHQTTLEWIDSLATIYGLPKEIEKIKGMAGAYVKEFAFVLEDDNIRIQDLQEIVEICRQKKVRLVYHLLPPNQYHARLLFKHLEKGNGTNLSAFLDYNHYFLIEKFKEWNVNYIDNFNLAEANELNAQNKGSFFTDQWYPTEHYNGVIKRKIAANIAAFISKKCDFEISDDDTVDAQLKQNNFPNWDIIMPLSYDGLTSLEWLSR